MATQDNAPQISQYNPINGLSSSIVSGVSPTIWPSITIPIGNTIAEVWLPTEPFAAGNLVFNKSSDNISFYPIRLVDGTPYTLVVGALTTGASYPIDPAVFYGSRYVQAVSTVAQANNTVINITVKPV